jgi:hypothetical protein
MAAPPVVIRVELARPTDMFQSPTIDLGSDLGGTIPGVERAVAELTAHPIQAPVQLEVVLPASEITPDVGERLGVSLRHYCDEHGRHNENLKQAMRRSGWRALRLGFPITLLGLIIVSLAGKMGPTDDPAQDVVEIIGWVFAWLGLWYPFDKVFFYPLDLVRENRALRALRDAQLTTAPYAARD